MNCYIMSIHLSFEEGNKQSSLKLLELSSFSNNMAVRENISRESWKLLFWATVLEGKASFGEEKLIENVLTPPF